MECQWLDARRSPPTVAGAAAALAPDDACAAPRSLFIAAFR